jgi:UMF1 family MFS transporter
MYDWAVSAVQTTIMVAVFPVYFGNVAKASLPESRATQAIATANTIVAVVLAILSPVLGAVSDYVAAKKRMLGASMIVGAAAVAGMFFVHIGDYRLALTLFVISLIGATASTVFYDSLLPHIASEDEIDRVSSAGYAVGYIGGGVLLALNLAWILKPQWFGLPSGPNLDESAKTLPTRLALLSVAVWWVVFSIPLFRNVPEPQTAGGDRGGSVIGAAFGRLGQTFREIRKYRHAFLLFIAMLLYQDGIQTVIRMSSVYGAEVGIDTNLQIAAFVMVQFVGIPFAFLFGALGRRIGTKNCIFIAIGVYIVAAGLAYFMTSVVHFFLLAFLVAMVLGGSQALSRALFARLIPQDRTSEFFGFFAVSERFATIMGPVLFFISATLTGSSRTAILGIVALFIAGAFVLSLVDEEEGARAALQ